MPQLTPGRYFGAPQLSPGRYVGGPQLTPGRYFGGPQLTPGRYFGAPSPFWLKIFEFKIGRVQPDHCGVQSGRLRRGFSRAF